MQLRLSNGHSFATEFTASNAEEFRSGIRRAALTFFAREGRHAIAQLHVATDSGEWLSANYPRSNGPYSICFGAVDRAEFASASRSNRTGTWFEFELAGLSDLLAE